MSPYAADAHGTIGLTKAGAPDDTKQGVRVNAIAPGPVRSPMMKAGWTTR